MTEDKSMDYESLVLKVRGLTEKVLEDFYKENDETLHALARTLRDLSDIATRLGNAYAVNMRIGRITSSNEVHELVKEFRGEE